MSFDLVNKNGETIGIGNVGWSKILILATMGGWVPAGTLAPEGWDENERVWDGNYSTNNGQRVTARDGLAMAKALEACLPGIPDEKHEDAGKVYTGLDGLLEFWLIEPEVYFSGKGKTKLQEFIDYFSEGEFEIR